MAAKDMEKEIGQEGKIEVLNFRKASLANKAFATPRVKDLKIVKRKGRRSVKSKLRMQLMKHYGFVLKDN